MENAGRGFSQSLREISTVGTLGDPFSISSVAKYPRRGAVGVSITYSIHGLGRDRSACWDEEIFSILL